MPIHYLIYGYVKFDTNILKMHMCANNKKLSHSLSLSLQLSLTLSLFLAQKFLREKVKFFDFL